MAWYDNTLKFPWPNILVVVGVGVLVPVLLPTLGYVLRPLVKGVVKAGLTVKDMTVGFMEEDGEQAGNLMAESKAEHYPKPEA